jgi:hypothetical protein
MANVDIAATKHIIVLFSNYTLTLINAHEVIIWDKFASNFGDDVCRQILHPNIKG